MTLSPQLIICCLDDADGWPYDKLAEPLSRLTGIFAILLVSTQPKPDNIPTDLPNLVFLQINDEFYANFTAHLQKLEVI